MVYSIAQCPPSLGVSGETVQGHRLGVETIVPGISGTIVWIFHGTVYIFHATVELGKQSSEDEEEEKRIRQSRAGVI